MEVRLENQEAAKQMGGGEQREAKWKWRLGEVGEIKRRGEKKKGRQMGWSFTPWRGWNLAFGAVEGASDQIN